MKNLWISSICFLLCIASFKANAQLDTLSIETRPKNIISANFLGNMSIFSVHGERLITSKGKNLFSAKLGFGINEEICILWCDDTRIKYNVLSGHLSYLASANDRLFFEFGIGTSTLFNNSQQGLVSSYIYPTAAIRLLPLRSDRFTLRLMGMLPIPLHSNHVNFLISPLGIELGLAF